MSQGPVGEATRRFSMQFSGVLNFGRPKKIPELSSRISRRQTNSSVRNLDRLEEREAHEALN